MNRQILIIVMLIMSAAPMSCKKSHLPLAEEYTLSSKDSFPEGVTFDPRGRAFYAGSLRGGTITRVLADGTENVFFESDEEVSFTGMKVDPCKRLLWVCAGFSDPSIPVGEEGYRYGEIWLFDLKSQRQIGEYALSDIAPGARCNDLIIDRAGIGYIPDSQKPNIYSIDPDQGSAQLFASDPILEPEFNLSTAPRFIVPGSNGVVITPDGRYLLVANTYASTLFRVSLDDPSQIIEVNLSGDDFSFPDGLVMAGETLYAVSSDRIHQVQFSGGEYDQGNVTSTAFVNGMTTATLAEGQLYVIKSLLAAGDAASAFPFRIIRVDLSLFDEP